MKKLTFILVCTGILTACGSSGGGGDASAAVDPSTPAITQPNDPALPNDPTVVPPVAPVTPVTIALTYYTLTKTITPTTSGHSYVGKGSCVQYLTNTYCWDDGFHTIPAYTSGGFSYGQVTNSFWNIGRDATSLYYSCFNYCTTDLALEPLFISTHVASNATALNFTPITTTINTVFSTGVATPVTCTLSTANELDCVDFSIDLNQVAL